MTFEDIRRIETEFDIKLPERYVRFLQRCDRSRVADAFYVDVKAIIENNRDLRTADCWQSDFFAIGGDGCGNIWCLNLLDPSVQVWIWEHDPSEGFSVEFTDSDALFQSYGG